MASLVETEFKHFSSREMQGNMKFNSPQSDVKEPLEQDIAGNGATPLVHECELALEVYGKLFIKNMGLGKHI